MLTLILSLTILLVNVIARGPKINCMRNDLSKKFVYLFYSRMESFRIEKFGVVGETRT